MIWRLRASLGFSQKIKRIVNNESNKKDRDAILSQHFSKEYFMKKSILLITLMSLFSLTSGANAANAPVNIAYPINGALVTNYFYSSFTTTCPGGAYSVKWYLDSTLIGNGTFYDTAGVHFAHKLPTGWHSLLVISSCGQDAVKFYVQ